MEIVILLVVVLAVIGVASAVSSRRSRRQAALETETKMGLARRVIDEDVTRFGEELQDLHIETMTTTLDTGMRQDYQRALDAYEHAKELLATARTEQDLAGVTTSLEDGRYAQACVLARQAGEPLPQRRPPCFFNPAHGPAQDDIEWAPPGGLPREIPVCLADAERVRAGAEPDTRKVRSRHRNAMVPWYEGGRAYAPYANGYYGAYAMNGLFPGILIGTMMAGTWSPTVVDTGSGAGEDWSGGDGGDFLGDGSMGGDTFGGGGFGGDSGGFGDFGGGDFGGGFDGGF